MQLTSSRDGALLAAADDDLGALADRLHDGALQALVVARYACDAVTRGADPMVARDAVQDALIALRHDVWLLRPRAGDGLATALAALSAQRVATGQAALRCDLDPAVSTGTVRIAPAAAAAAYRLVQAVLATVGAAPLAVRLTGDGTLHLDAAVPDPAIWSLRAETVGAVLQAGPASTLLLLPTDEDHP